MTRKELLIHAKTCFLEYTIGKGLKAETILRKQRELDRFLDHVEALEKDLREVQAEDIETYFIYLKDNGYSKSTLGTARSTISDLFVSLIRQNSILQNPMDFTDIVIREKAGAKVIFSEGEIDHFLGSIETVTGYGLRDRCIFELMYVTGMRVGELVSLDIEDVDFSLNEVMIREGKGRKDRIVPLGKVAKTFLERWVKTVRAYFLKDVNSDTKALFLSEKGVRIGKPLIGHRFKLYLKLAKIEKKGLSPHSLRHSTATHLLSNGADIIFVAELLGHESLVTTQVYTTQVVEGLKKTHKMYHPRENELYREDI